MFHTHYYEIEAKDNFYLGIRKGELFGSIARTTLEKKKQKKYWNKKVELSKDCLLVTQKYFPQLIEELQGYAKASNINFVEFWTMSLENDLDYLDTEKCTTVVTNEGKLISHNEDWDDNAQDAICVLKKTLKGLTTLELFYYNTLGGISACVNSSGYGITVNTLAHTDRQIGVPRNVVARWLSETHDVENDFEKLKNIPRSLGYNHVFANTQGRVWDLECSALRQVLVQPQLPFVHTNHFLDVSMKDLEKNDNSTGSYDRYKDACSLARPLMTIDEIMDLNNRQSENKRKSIMNIRTIGKMIIDLQNLQAKIWLKRESEKGWVDYRLGFINN